MRYKKRFPVILFFSCCLVLFSCKKGSDTPLTPPVAISEMTIQDVSQPRMATNSTMQFYLNLNKAATNAVSVDYTLVDGTATASKDYVAGSGTLTIPASQTQATIDVQLKGDPTNLRQNNLEFTVKLTNPKLCTIVKSTAKGTLLTEDGTYLPTDNTGYTAPSTYPGYTLAWSDEFTGTNLDAAVWNQETGNGSGGWGNNELEYYTNNLKNSFLSDGKLIIEARKEAISGFNYSSARLTTQNKKNIKFGRIDIRAKLPVSKGMWPALWMLGANINTVGWPACGEMDIMELVGSAPGTVKSTMHWKSIAGTHLSNGLDYNLPSGDFSQQFHVFSMVWGQDNIRCYVNDKLTSTTTSTSVGAAYPFNAEQFFIFNVAVGGDWPGSPDAYTLFPQRMFVDYVRVFQ